MATALRKGTVEIGRVGISPTLGQPYETPYTWTRPGEWIPLPTAPTQGMSGLIGIYNDDSNYVALRVTGTGTYNVDWGDGTSSLGVASAVTAEKKYEWDTVASATFSHTETVDGMRQAIVTVTPVSGNLTVIDLNRIHSRSSLVTGTSDNWLELDIAGGSLTSVIVSGATVTSRHSYLESVRVTASTLTSMANMFNGCVALQNVSIIGSVAAVTSMGAMFQSCASLINITSFQGSVSAVTNMQAMFQGCSSLQTIPAFPGSVAGVTTMNAMFAACSSLQTIPAFPGSVAGVTNMLSMFSACRSLKYIPAFPGSVAAVTNMSSMFATCSSLIAIPAFPGSVAAVVNMSSMFDGCGSLRTIPAFPGSVAAVTTMATMFQNCYNLQSIPAFPGSVAAVTNMSSMFATCSSLIAIPAFPGSVAAVTTMANMFTNCYALQTIPAFPGSVAAVTTMANMFQNCSALQTLPAWPSKLSALATISSMFVGCTLLQSLPGFPSMSSLTVADSFVSGCSTIRSLSADFDYHVLRDRAPTLTTPNWTLTTGWSYGTGPNRLIKVAGSANTATALQPTITVTTSLAADSIIDTTTPHGFQIGDHIKFTAITGGAGLKVAIIYKVIATNFGANTFMVSDVDDVPVLFTTNITAGSVWRTDLVITATGVYRVVITSTGRAGTALTATLGGAAVGSITTDTHTAYVTATTSAKLIFTAAATTAITITGIVIEHMMTHTTMLGTAVSFTTSNLTNIRRTCSFASLKMSRLALVQMMNNVGTSAPTGQTLTMTGNHGTVDLTAAAASLAASPSGTVINTATAHGLLAGDYVRFSSITGGSGLSTLTTYRVIAAGLGSTTFSVSLPPPAVETVITFTTNITAGLINRFDLAIAQVKGWTTSPAV